MLLDSLIAVLVLLLIVALPLWPYSRQWGFYGAVGIAALLAVVFLLIHLYVF